MKPLVIKKTVPADLVKEIYRHEGWDYPERGGHKSRFARCREAGWEFSNQRDPLRVVGTKTFKEPVQ
jgi:hypothetical protein